jgi:hypothetical protein
MSEDTFILISMLFGDLGDALSHRCAGQQGDQMSLRKKTKT